MNDITDAVKPQESPSIQAHVTEIPPTPPPHQRQDKKSLSEVSGAAAYRNPEVSDTSYLVSQAQMESVTYKKKSGKLKIQVCGISSSLFYCTIVTLVITT